MAAKKRTSTYRLLGGHSYQEKGAARVSLKRGATVELTDEQATSRTFTGKVELVRPGVEIDEDPEA